MATANIIVGIPSSIATPPAGEATLFVNPDDNNIVWIKFDNGTSKRYSSGDLDCCTCEIAKQLTDAITCAFSKGLIDATEFGVLLGTGISVTTTSGTDDDGNTFNNVTVGTKNIPVTGMSIDGASSRTMLCNGTMIQFTATVLPATASNKKVKWLSSNTAVVTIDINTGLATQVGAGSAIITAYTEDGGFTDTVSITANGTGC